MSKYRTLIVAIALFLVFDLGVLILNFYVSAAISKDAASVNLAGRQRMLSQRMVKGLLETQIAMEKGEELAKPLDELKKSFTLFDDTLNAFSQGGQTMSGNGELFKLMPCKIKPPSRLSIKRLRCGRRFVLSLRLC
ncbi:type IV pili methyl-accepting chemotaxis transducer N-terminal domain-containing protein [Methylocucumis oryzae]|nr:type IV pili methyl-accepting chemotaxis transducer N-terminal domain-containing protein [Methylocucumis oryzae]